MLPHLRTCLPADTTSKSCAPRPTSAPTAWLPTPAAPAVPNFSTTPPRTIRTSTTRGAPLLSCRSIFAALRPARRGSDYGREGVNSSVALQLHQNLVETVDAYYRVPDLLAKFRTKSRLR